MPDKQQLPILEDDVFALTPKAQRELGGAGTSLSATELKVLVLIDGKSTVSETLSRASTFALGNEASLFILRKLAVRGLIQIATRAAGSLDFVDFFEIKGPVTPSMAAIAQAKKATAATTLLLQQQGYFVRIVRRPSTKRKLEQGQILSILVVEDEPVLAGILRHALETEGFSARNAKNREEIVAEFRRPPRPDLVLLDVMLPDVDGFDVLLTIRQHPVLKTLPVVMLTSKATRGAVLKGLAGGADGYITKPFEIPVLVKAVNAVLGLSEEGQADELDQDLWPP
jgi:two-component system OmpR family response regulator